MTLYYFYKICSLDNEYIYIGSTTKFKKRVFEHKSDCYNKKSKKYNIKLYTTIRKNGGIENFRFDIIKSIETDDKKNVLKQEQELMILYNSNLNTNKAFISDEDKTQYKKQYRIDNKEQIQQKTKQYRIDNKELIKQQRKKYSTENREQIRLKKSEKHICVCGRLYTYGHRKRHTESTQHKKYEEQQIVNNTTNNITINYNITIQK